MGKYNKAAVLTVLMVFVLALVGCGKNRNDDTSIAEDINQIEAEEASSALASALSDKLGINEEKWEEDLAVLGSMVSTVRVSAQVTFPDTDHMCVLALQKRFATGEERKALLEAICGDNEICAFDSSNPPSWYYESWIKRLELEISDVLNAKKNNQSLTSTGGEWGEDDDEYYENLLSQLSDEQEMYENAPEAETDLGNYDADGYMSQGEDERTIIYFFDDSISWDMDGIHTVKEDFSSADSCSIFADTIDYGNICGISEEEAILAAKTYISDLGIEDFDAVETSPITFCRTRTGEGSEYWTDGYAITFTRSVDGVLEDTNGYLFSHKDSEGIIVESYDNTFGETVQVYVNDTGVFHCDIGNPYMVSEIVSSDTLLLSYDQVKDVIRTVLTSEVDDLYSSYTGSTGIVTIGNMELIYFLDTSGEHCSLLPVWRFCNMTTDGTNQMARDFLLINAIDGSIIEVKEK